MAYGTGETGHRELPCGARAPDGGTAHRASRGRHRHCRTRRGAREPDGRSTRMLEPTEPTEGSDNNNTPSDTLPPRRRRRAASRPAGPPTGAAESQSVAETTAPAIPPVASAEA